MIANAKILPKAESIILNPTVPYDMKSVKSPPLQGMALWAGTKLIESPFGGSIYSVVGSQSGITEVLHGTHVPEKPLFRPHLPLCEENPALGCRVVDVKGAHAALAALTADALLPDLPDITTPRAPPSPPPADSPAATAPPAAAAYRRPTIVDYVAAYQSGASSPSAVAERIIAFAAACKDFHWFTASYPEDIRRQAAQATERWQAGRPLSVLDGVPYGLKDLIDAEPYTSSCGTSFLSSTRKSEGDAPYIAALRHMGAILIGKTSLHELALGITGLNTSTGTARNPLNPAHYCGGSSSGSAGVLAAGLCPIAIGSDGGGSIRIPSSFCGLVGLKPTNGRVSPECQVDVENTVATNGPMAGSVRDAIILHAAMADFAAREGGQAAPPLSLPMLRALGTTSSSEQPLKGTRAGIFWPWFEDAEAEVVKGCKAAVEVLKGLGAEVVEVGLPDLELLRVAHNVTILTEMHHNFQPYWDDMQYRGKLGLDVRMSLSIARFWTGADYVQAQRIRSRCTTHFQRAMEAVDVLLTPTTPCTAPAIPAGAPTKGNADVDQVGYVMRFVLPGNLLGLPAISLPVAEDGRGLPVGLQIIGKAWQEGAVLRYAAELEEALQQQRPGQGPFGQPMTWIDPLTGASQPPPPVPE